MRHRKRTKRKRFGTWRCSPEDYQNLRRAYQGLEKRFKIYGKAAQADHFELLQEYCELRDHPLVQFLMFLRLVPRKT